MTKTQKHHVGVQIEKNSFVDAGGGRIEFPNGMVIIDGAELRNGYKYDMDTMDISEYQGQVTADHHDVIEKLIAGVEGVEKQGNRVIVRAINYLVKESALGRLAYDLAKNPKVPTNFSVETYGPWPDGSDDTYYKAKLIGLSQVVVGNSKSAVLNSIVKNSLEQSREDGLDTTEAEKLLKDELEITINTNHTTEDPAESEEDKAKREEAEKLAQQQADDAAKQAAEEAEAEKKAQEAKEAEEAEAAKKKAEEEAAAKAAEEEAARQSEAEQSAKDEETKQNNNTKNKENDEMKFVTIKNSRDFPVAVTFKNAAGDEQTVELEAGKTVDVSEDQQEAVESQLKDAEAPKVDNAAEIEKAVNAVDAKWEARFAELKEAFDKSAKEPAFKPAAGDDEDKAKNEFADLDYKERHGKQINAAWEYLKLGRIEAAGTLNKINEVNLQALKDSEKVSNTLSLSDFGNFVISPELLTDIQGYRTDYTALIGATDWRETNSLEFAWLKRQGDIDMKSVDLEPGEDGNGNLKPISEYSAEPVVSKLEELAAVTPVCNSATRFLAVDLLGDVARGYRNDYDRKRAQLVVARLQQAVDANSDNSIDYSVTPTSVEALVGWSALWAKVAEVTINGVFVFNTSTYALVQQAAVRAGANGPLSQIFTTGDVPMIFGRPYIIVPNDLMPTLNSGDTVTVEVEGEDVEIDHAVFYFDTSNFTGRTSGGLQYDLSTDAAYEVAGVVKSAYQRNELVLRGSFFRGGAILDDARVSGMKSDLAPAS